MMLTEYKERYEAIWDDRHEMAGSSIWLRKK